tara:strand:- start:17 stop:733 length:717 start_codon:yes stop_codon:yes gene_type:complete
MNKTPISNYPKHLAIIMDGNGRWAKEKGMNRIKGHKAGVEVVRKITEFCVEKKIKYLTLYTFSEENWKRPKNEVSALMRLLVSTLNEELDLFLNNNVRLNIIGNVEKMDFLTRNTIKKFINKTAKNDGLILSLALSYGSRQEIIYAINQIFESNPKGKVSIEDFEAQLYTNNIPDPDLLIRTGGENRISNFLLWQIAYTEIYFSKVFWPDFGIEELSKALCDYDSRERRYGKTSEQLK